MQKRAVFSPIYPADTRPKKLIHPSAEKQLAVTQHCPQHSTGPASKSLGTVGAGGSYSLVMLMKKVGLGAPPGTVLPPEIYYGGLACLQASLDPN